MRYLLAATVLTFVMTETCYATTADTLSERKSVLTRVLDYFNNANKDTVYRRFSFSIIGGPHYDTDTKLGLGLAGTGLYRTDSTDLKLPPSNVAVYGDVTTAGFFLVGIRGTHIAPHDRTRITYNLRFESFRTKFWGMGYASGNNDGNESLMTTRGVSSRVSYLWRTARNLYLGPVLAYDFNAASRIRRPELLGTMSRHTINTGVGVALNYDSRDVLTNPSRGAFIDLTQYVRPRFMGNNYAFSTTDLNAAAYRRVWSGGILAVNIAAQFNFGNPAWGMLAELGGPRSMRGYYEGRYRDKHKMEGQIELRQHVWRRNGIVLWAGAGTVFSRFSRLRLREVLPNFGAGYRWEFKKNVNVRLDYGFGKSGQRGFTFNIGEAF